MKEAFDLIRKEVRLLSEQEFCKRRKQEECDKYVDCETCLIDAVLSIVSEVEAEYGNGWIPCSERLPEEPKENPFFEGKPLELYLVSMKHDKYPWRAFWNGKDFTDGWSIVQPEAWMPLPESYKSKGEGQ